MFTFCSTFIWILADFRQKLTINTIANPLHSLFTVVRDNKNYNESFNIMLCIIASISNLHTQTYKYIESIILALLIT